MLDKQKMLERLSELPLYEYDFMDTSELTFSERIRVVCREECPRYNKSWACPPAVGEISDCIARVRSYPEFLLISTITEVSDIANLEETLATRADHEKITKTVRDMLAEEVSEIYVLSTESCAFCEHCTWPNGKCRNPDKMFPCVESHGILVTDLAEKRGLEFLAGSNLVTWYSILLFKE